MPDRTGIIEEIPRAPLLSFSPMQASSPAHQELVHCRPMRQTMLAPPLRTKSSPTMPTYRICLTVRTRPSGNWTGVRKGMSLTTMWPAFRILPVRLEMPIHRTWAVSTWPDLRRRGQPMRSEKTSLVRGYQGLGLSPRISESFRCALGSRFPSGGREGRDEEYSNTLSPH